MEYLSFAKYQEEKDTASSVLSPFYQIIISSNSSILRTIANMFCLPLLLFYTPPLPFFFFFELYTSSQTWLFVGIWEALTISGPPPKYSDKISTECCLNSGM